MRTAKLAIRTAIFAWGSSVLVACSNSGNDQPGASAPHSGGLAGLAQGPGAEHASGGAPAEATGGGGIATSGTAGESGLSGRGGSIADAGRGGVPAGAGGATTGGQSGGNAHAGGGAAGSAPVQGGMSGVGGSGGFSGAQGGVSGQSGASGNGSTGGAAACGELVLDQRSISFGTLLSADGVMCAARKLAATASNPSSPTWRTKGDQHRKYHFADANADEPYRLYVPTTWDGKAALPLALFLHGSGSDENTYVDQNNMQLLKLAEQHGYLLVAPLGADGAYGNFLRLSSPFGQPDEAAKLMAQVTADTERTNELSERDVINVLELVLAEYPVARDSLFLFGHSMGSGGTWYLGGKYAGYFRGLAPMSGPFVQETGYPWDDLRQTRLFVTEGTQAPSVAGSHALRDWLAANGFKAEYEEVNADHAGMIPLVLPDVFDFFDRSRSGT